MSCRFSSPRCRSTSWTRSATSDRVVIAYPRRLQCVAIRAFSATLRAVTCDVGRRATHRTWGVPAWERSRRPRRASSSPSELRERRCAADALDPDVLGSVDVRRDVTRRDDDVRRQRGVDSIPDSEEVDSQDDGVVVGSRSLECFARRAGARERRARQQAVARSPETVASEAPRERTLVHRCGAPEGTRGIGRPGGVVEAARARTRRRGDLVVRMKLTPGLGRMFKRRYAEGPRAVRATAVARRRVLVPEFVRTNEPARVHVVEEGEGYRAAVLPVDVTNVTGGCGRSGSRYWQTHAQFDRPEIHTSWEESR